MLLNEAFHRGVEMRVARAQGASFWDEHDRQYLDCSMVSGAMMLGHANAVLVRAIERQARLGTVFGEPHRAAELAAQSVCDALGETVHTAFCSSGTEAVMRAIRVARAATGRSRIAMFAGCFHGTLDEVLLNPETDKASALSAGTLPFQLNHLLVLRYGRDTAIEALEAADDVAAVLVEPVPASLPVWRPAFLQRLVQVARARSILVIFDEVITGFRIGISGAAGNLGLSPDIRCLGKVLGNGLPLGAVALSVGVAARLASVPRVVFGGTFSANPLGTAVAHATLSYLMTHPEVFAHIDAWSDCLRAEINWLFDRQGVPWVMVGSRSVSRLLFTREDVADRVDRDRHEAKSAAQRSSLLLHLRANGIHVGDNGIWCACIAHEDKHVEFIARTLSAWLERRKDLE